jgi:hypothetical protein
MISPSTKDQVRKMSPDTLKAFLQFLQSQPASPARDKLVDRCHREMRATCLCGGTRTSDKTLSCGRPECPYLRRQVIDEGFNEAYMMLDHLVENLDRVTEEQATASLTKIADRMESALISGGMLKEHGSTVL